MERALGSLRPALLAEMNVRSAYRLMSSSFALAPVRSGKSSTEIVFIETNARPAIPSAALGLSGSARKQLIRDFVANPDLANGTIQPDHGQRARHVRQRTCLNMVIRW
jgi:hypothetical protein